MAIKLASNPTNQYNKPKVEDVIMVMITIKMNRFIDKVAVITATNKAINNARMIDEITMLPVVNLTCDGVVSKTINLESTIDSGNINTDKYNVLENIAVSTINTKSNEPNI